MSDPITRIMDKVVTLMIDEAWFRARTEGPPFSFGGWRLLTDEEVWPPGTCREKAARGYCARSEGCT